MGNIFSRSLPAPTPTDTKRILDTILYEMFRRADFIDLYSLADPERCKRYIVVAESALKGLFVRIELQPRLGPDGTFFFQKIEGLQKRNPLGEKQTEYCRVLAFFFIRIFQIYAALALSILDTELPQADILSLEDVRAKQRGLVVLQPTTVQGFPDTKKGADFGSGFLSFFGLKGGALGRERGYESFYLREEQAGLYKLLNLYLNRPSDGVKSTSEMRFQNYDTMLIAQDQLYDFPDLEDASKRQVKGTLSNTTPLSSTTPLISFTFRPSNISNSYETVTANLKIERDQLRLRVSLINLKRRIDPNAPVKSMEGELFYPSESSEKPISRSGQELPSLLVELFKKGYEELNPQTVSAIPFLQKFKLIKKFEGDVPIEGTQITIPNPKSLFVKGDKDVPIVYRGKIQPPKEEADGRERSITIQTTLSVKKEDYVVGEPHSYTVIVSLDPAKMEVDPPQFKSRLSTIQKSTTATFQTGYQDMDTPTSKKGKTLPVFLQDTFKALLSGEGANDETGGIVFKKGLPQPYNSDTLPPALKVKALWQALAQTPPIKSYCVARAVQLLNVAALRNELSPQGYSEACNLKFPYAEGDYVPTPKKPITNVAGIRALELLFFDTLEKGIPNVGLSKKYQDFVQKMKATFQYVAVTEENAAATAAAAPNTASGAKAQTALEKVMAATPAACQGAPAARIPVEGGEVRALRNKARELLQRQANHIPKVMMLLFKMFDQQKLMQGTFAFNGQFIAQGMPAVNRLAEEAREVLMEYYSDCEMTYKEGLDILGKRMPAAAPAAVPAQQQPQAKIGNAPAAAPVQQQQQQPQRS